MLIGIYYTTLTLAAIGEVALGEKMIDLGNKLGNMSAVGVLGVVAVVSLYMLQKLYKDKNNESKIVLDIAQKAVAAIEKNTAKSEDQIKLLETMHTDISLCRKLNTEKMNKASAVEHLKTFGG